jgi:K+ transporter
MPKSMARATASADHQDQRASHFWPLTLGAMGVVFRDIDTSPLYRPGVQVGSRIAV